MKNIFCLLVAALLTAMPAVAGEIGDLRLSIGVEKNEYKKGEPIAVTARLVNMSDGEVAVPSSLGEEGEYLFFEVRNSLNQHEYGSTVCNPTFDDETGKQTLKPQGSIERRYLIRHDFDEGQYSLSAHYRAGLLERLWGKKVNRVLVSNSADFMVNPAD